MFFQPRPNNGWKRVGEQRDAEQEPIAGAAARAWDADGGLLRQIRRHGGVCDADELGVGLGAAQIHARASVDKTLRVVPRTQVCHKGE